ncbi:hypothetical protein [Desulfopila sp. IMCC35006]|nr:hypothetical protein [Desulfopila sp. IMCC35006]
MSPPNDNMQLTALRAAADVGRASMILDRSISYQILNNNWP